MKKQLLGLLTLTITLGLQHAISAPQALACGGFFCTTVPVDQAGERILFAQDGDEIVSHVQIQYSGAAENFSWVVPVPSPPKLGIGSDLLFSTLSQRTQPQFRLTNSSTIGSCKELPQPLASSAPSAAESDGVSVISEQEVGPFASAVVQSDDPNALKNWLEDNGYQVPDTLNPLLDPYVKNGSYFLALKLKKGSTTGDLQPITMRYKADKPGIPIRLTAVAATPDMDVFVWILGKNRAIPQNYKHAEINETRINWQSRGSNYRQVVTEAINETGGQGFVTDYAGDSSIISTGIFSNVRFRVDELKEQKDPFAFRDSIRNGDYFISNTQFSSLDSDRYFAYLSRHIPRPESLKNTDVLSYVQNLEAFRGEIEASGIQVNTEAAIKELQETVIEPFEEIETLFKTHPYLTRLYTTISPQEMVTDPVFEFNADLPKVSNIHEATEVRICDKGQDIFNAPVQITLKNGVTFEAPRFQALNEGPAAEKITQLASTGQGFVVLDNSTKIETLAKATVSELTASAEPSRSPSGVPTGIPSVPASGEPFVTPSPSSMNTSASPAAMPSAIASPELPEVGTGCACNSPSQPPPLSKGSGEGFTYTLALAGFLGWRKRKKKK